MGRIEHEAAVIGDDFYVRDLVMQLPCFRRWSRQMSTDYADLPESEKESDREVVREKLRVYREEVERLRRVADCHDHITAELTVASDACEAYGCGSDQ